MLYPGNIKYLVLSITDADGSNPTVTVPPTVLVVNMTTGSTVLAATTMNLMASTEAVYTYAWSTTGMAVGDYIAIVSYATSLITVNGRMLEVFRLGDTNITGPVALDATVAHDATVAKDATVAHVADLASISPDNSVTVLAIKAKTDNLPVDPASLSILNTYGALIQDIHNSDFGTWTIDKTQSPQVLTILAPGGATLAKFNLTDSSTATQRAPQ